MGKTLSELVRDQILVGGPQIGDGIKTQAEVEYRREEYVNEQLDAMTRAELLDRISDAQEQLTRELSVRLGL
jgi:hypothetical protein